MAKENGEPTAEEKGKGKMTAHPATNGEKESEGLYGDNTTKLTKDLVRPEENKDGMLFTLAVEQNGVVSLHANLDVVEELSEEDQQLKNELEMLIDRLVVRFCQHV